MTNTDGFSIRAIEAHEMSIILDWAAAEGWNPGLHDGEIFHAVDPAGFLLGELDGVPVSSVSVVRYADEFGFLGFYLADPAYRGRGYGYRVWQAGMAHLDGCNVGLDGVVAQQENYKKSGFEYAFANFRYRGLGGGTCPSSVVSLAEVPFDRLCAYDRRCFASSRTAFLASWIAQPKAWGFAVLTNGNLAGFVVARACREGYKIGPLYADHADGAEQLLRAVFASVGKQAIYLDVPAPNEFATSLAQQFGMQPVFETARMYTRGRPAVAEACIFGVTTFELG